MISFAETDGGALNYGIDEGLLKDYGEIDCNVVTVFFLLFFGDSDIDEWSVCFDEVFEASDVNEWFVDDSMEEDGNVVNDFVNVSEDWDVSWSVDYSVDIKVNAATDVKVSDDSDVNDWG